MKTIIERYPLFSKRMIMAVVFFVLVISCSKNSNDPSNTALKFCGSMDWTSTLGISGYFKGNLVSSTFGITSVNFKDNKKNTTLVLNRDANGHITGDNFGDTYTYDQDNLIKIVTGTETGSITFTFDASSHLKQVYLQSTEVSQTSELTLTYTYDTNGDPVTISGEGLITSGDLTTNGYYTITADYLTDKTNVLPLLPEIAPFTSTFAYSWFLSQHLINKWQIRVSSISSDGTFNDNTITQQFKYTYDSDGRVATMSHTSNNIFTFTYSGCN
jgi:hypothetical protein